MAWEKFNSKVSAPMHGDGRVGLDIRSSGAIFTFAIWRDVLDKTHAVYYVNEEEKQIGLKLVNEYDASDEDMAIAYKITKNGYRAFSVTCTKLLKYLSFDLVSMTPRAGKRLEFGKWSLTYEIADGMIVINSEE